MMNRIANLLNRFSLTMKGVGMNLEYLDLSSEKEKLMLEYPQQSIGFNLLKNVNSTVSKKEALSVLLYKRIRITSSNI